MKTTARFHIQRLKALEEVFSQKNLVETWRKLVRQQLRSQDILDLHDYYDFNLNIEEQSALIQQKIISGQYKAKPPLIFKLEKKYGVCRHMLLLSPSDSLVLQTIVEKSLADKLIQSQPTKQAYYSRDKHSLKLPHQVGNDFYLTWLEKWKKFQKELWKFRKERNFLAVTNLTNYYDNIGLRELRHVVSSRAQVSEVILDLLFNIIEQLSWCPDYLPTSLKGLPTISLEAPRLLAHTLLFEIDEVLESRTHGCFVRWMDDINFGVDSVEEAYRIFGEVNDVLKSRGLALNLGKTAIYTFEEVENHFLVKENQFLDSVEENIKKGLSNENILEIEERFTHHQNHKDLRNWSKVTKRFLTIVGKVKSEHILLSAKNLFIDHPDVRSNVIFYLYSLGFKDITATLFLELLEEVPIYDDVTLFALVKLLTDWAIPFDNAGKEFIERVYLRLENVKSPFEYYCLLWFSAKYRKPSHVASLIQSTKPYWSHDPFLRRQMCSILPRTAFYKEDLFQKLLFDEISSGLEDSASVAGNIEYLSSLQQLPFQVSSYLFPSSKQNPYPLAKFLILLACLISEDLNKDSGVKTKVGEYIQDPWYLHWVNTYVY